MVRTEATDFSVDCWIAAICCADLLGRLRGLRGERLDLRGDDREAAAGFAGARGLDRGVECQQVGLRGDRLDQPDHVADLLRAPASASISPFEFRDSSAALRTTVVAFSTCWPISLIERDSSSAAPATFCTLAEACLRGCRRAGRLARGRVSRCPRATSRCRPCARHCRRPPQAICATEAAELADQRLDAALAHLALRLLGMRGFLQPRPLDRIVAEYRDRARHAADLVLALAAADFDRRIAARERQRGVDQRPERAGDRARRRVGGQRSNRDQAEPERQREHQRRGSLRRYRGSDRLEIGGGAILDLLQLVDPRGRRPEPVRRRNRLLGLARGQRDRGVAHAGDVGARGRGQRGLQRLLLRRRALAPHGIELLLLRGAERHEAAQIARAEAARKAACPGRALLAGEFLAAHHRRIDPDRAHDPGIRRELRDAVDRADHGGDGLGVGASGLGRRDRLR